MTNVESLILFEDSPLPPSSRSFFPEPFLLRQLGEEHLPVVRFAITSPALYREFRKTRGVALEVADYVAKQFLTDSHTKGSIVVRCPFVDVNAPLPEAATVGLNATAIRGVIESFYRAWQGERMEYYRTAMGVPESVVPVLLLNRDCGAIGQAFSRSPRTGEKTSIKNWEGDLVGAIRSLAPETCVMLSKSEKILHYPVALSVTNVTRKKMLMVCGAQRLDLTQECSLRVFMEMLRDGELNLSEFLSRISLSWFRGANTFGVHPPSFKSVGIAAGPGAAIGPAYFRPLPNGRIRKDGIFVVGEVSPEDFRMMIASQAVVSTRGGVTSHAALAARQMGKVCVVALSDFEIDEAARIIRCGPLVAVEKTLCIVNGETGEVAFLVGGPDSIFVNHTVAKSAEEHLRTLKNMLDKQLPIKRGRLSRRNVELLNEIKSLFDLIDES